MNNLIAQELIIPKPQPGNRELIKKELKILPKAKQKVIKLNKDEVKNTETISQYKEQKIKLGKTIIPKDKPILDNTTQKLVDKKKYILPQKKPVSKKVIDEIKEEKEITKIPDPKLIFPQKKPIVYEKPK